MKKMNRNHLMGYALLSVMVAVLVAFYAYLISR